MGSLCIPTLLCALAGFSSSVSPLVTPLPAGPVGLFAAAGSNRVIRASEEETAQAPAPSGDAPSSVRAQANLIMILTDRTVWGKDFPTALAQLANWKRIGERQVALFPNRIMGETAYDTPESAQPAARRLTEAMGLPQPTPRAEFATRLKNAARPRPPLWRVETLRSLPDDESVRLFLGGPSLQILAPRLTIATILKRFGPPEEITREALQNETDRRPVILTLYRYAGGALIFAESGYAPEPGFVDRVLINVPAGAAAVFQEAK